jgi:hypothetical protein
VRGLGLGSIIVLVFLGILVLGFLGTHPTLAAYLIASMVSAGGAAAGGGGRVSGSGGGFSGSGGADSRAAGELGRRRRSGSW